MNNVNASPLKKKKGGNLNTNYLVVIIAIVIHVIIWIVLFKRFFPYSNTLLSSIYETVIQLEFESTGAYPKYPVLSSFSTFSTSLWFFLFHP